MSSRNYVGSRGRIVACGVVSLIAASVMGCVQDDGCTVGASECHGNALWSCLQPDDGYVHHIWSKGDCAPGFCRTLPGGIGGTYGRCFAEADPNPACAPEAPNVVAGSSACTADGRAVQCESGYVLSVLDTCSRPELCVPVVVKVAESCVLDPTLDVRCRQSVGYPFGTRLQVCDSGHVLTCAAGYLIADQDCGPGIRCAVASPSAASCK